MTNETTPDAVEAALCKAFEEFLAKRARRAKEVARLEERCQSREEQLGKLSEAVEALARRFRELVQDERDPTAADRDTSSHWCPMATAPRDGTEVALLFAREETVTFGVLSTWPRVRAAFFTGSDWSIPYYASNPPIGWAPLPAPPTTEPPTAEEHP